jgi:hypothetical protein
MALVDSELAQPQSSQPLVDGVRHPAARVVERPCVGVEADAAGVLVLFAGMDSARADFEECKKFPVPEV